MIDSSQLNKLTQSLQYNTTIAIQYNHCKQYNHCNTMQPLRYNTIIAIQYNHCKAIQWLQYSAIIAIKYNHCNVIQSLQNQWIAHLVVLSSNKLYKQLFSEKLFVYFYYYYVVESTAPSPSPPPLFPQNSWLVTLWCFCLLTTWFCNIEQGQYCLEKAVWLALVRNSLHMYIVQ